MKVLTDFSVGIRQMKKNPGSAVLAIVAYSFGLGVVGFMLTIIFGLVLGHPESVERGELNFLRWDPSTRHQWKSGAQNENLRYPDFRELHEQQTAFASLAAYRGATFNLRIDDFAKRFQGSHVTANFFQTLALQPQLGHFFVAGDDSPDANRKIILSDAVWRNEFQADSAIIGASVIVNGQSAEVVGVAPAGFDFPGQDRVWMNERIDPLAVDRAAGDIYTVFGRLKSSHTLETANAELNAIATRLEAAHPETNTGYTAFEIQSLNHYYMGPDFSRLFFLMFICSLLVLLIACTNIANLTLSRATTRAKELAIRASLGGNRIRLVRQMVVEGFSIALFGGIGGLIVTIWTSKALWAWIQKTAEVNGVPGWMNVDVDLEVIASLSAITMLASVIASIVPALKASRADVNSTLKDNSRGATGMKIGVFSKLLVFLQICVSCGMLVTTSAMVSNAKVATAFEPPYDPARMMVARFDLPDSYGFGENRAAFLRRLRERLEANPELEGVGFTSAYDMVINWNTRWDVRGRERATEDDYVMARHELVSDNYFDLMDIPILQGRGFEAFDGGEDAQQICVVNTLLAESLWPGESPLGKQIRDVWSETNPWVTVVGVVPDTQMAGPGQRRPEDRGGVYRPIRDHPQNTISVFAKSSGDPSLQAAAMRAVLREEDPNLALYRVKPVQQAVNESNFGNIFFRNIFGFFGIAALALASIGVYGVMDFSVRQRFQEFGIRRALGARKAAIMTHVLRLGGFQVAVGITLGAALGWIVLTVIGQALGDVRMNVFNFLVPIVVIAAIAGVALFTPAREVTNANLADCLRND